MSDKKEISESSMIYENSQNNYVILNEDCSNYDFSFKVVIIGNSGNLINI